MTESHNAQNSSAESDENPVTLNGVVYERISTLNQKMTNAENGEYQDWQLELLNMNLKMLEDLLEPIKPESFEQEVSTEFLEWNEEDRRTKFNKLVRVAGSQLEVPEEVRY